MPVFQDFEAIAYILEIVAAVLLIFSILAESTPLITTSFSPPASVKDKTLSSAAELESVSNNSDDRSKATLITNHPISLTGPKKQTPP